MNVLVYLLNGEGYNLSLFDHATIRNVKEALPHAYPWQIHLFPYDCTENQPLSIVDSTSVADKDVFRACIHATDTRILSFEKGTHPFDAMTNDDLLARMSVYYLETGQRTNGADRLEQTPYTEYYVDMESMNEWSSTTVKNPLVVFLRMYFKGAYKGSIDQANDRYQVYRMMCNQSA